MPVEVKVESVTIDKLSERRGSFGYKAKGIFNGEFFQRLDGTASGESKFYNFFVTKNGEPYGHYDRRGGMKAHDFEKILRFTEKKMVQLAEKILSGKIHPSLWYLTTIFC